jgi:hypothetical protein
MNFDFISQQRPDYHCMMATKKKAPADTTKSYEIDANLNHNEDNKVEHDAIHHGEVNSSSVFSQPLLTLEIIFCKVWRQHMSMDT